MKSRIHVIGQRSRIVRAGCRFGIEGRIKAVELIDAKTGFIKRRLTEFPNLITDAGLNAVGNGTQIDDLVDYVAVGTDNTTPAVTDTALGAQVDDRYQSTGGFSDVAASGPSYAYWSYTRTREIDEAFGNGNLTELGFFSALSGGTMWCRQLFLSGGSPTTVTKTSNEKLRIIYEWRIYLVTTPTTDVLTIDTVSTDCDSRALQGNDGDAWGADGYIRYLGNWTTDERRANAYETQSFPTIDGGNFTGSAENASSISMVAYSSGTFQRDMDIVFEPGVANFVTGIGAINLPYVGSFLGGTQGLGTTFDPKVDKDNTERFTFRARIAFGRH